MALCRPTAIEAMGDVPAAILNELARPYPLDPDCIDAFQRDGFVHLRGVFSESLLAFFGPKIVAVVDEEDRNAKPLEQRSTYERAFTQITNLWPRHEGIRAFSLNPRCARIAAELLGCAGVRMWHDQALFKRAGGGITPWHVDQFFWPLSSDLSVSVWIPLQPAAIDAGAPYFAAGSQRDDHGRGFGISDRSESEIGAALAAAGTRVVAEPYALGDVSFHAGWTCHGAGPNQSGTDRAAMTMIYIDAAMRVAKPANPFQEYDRKTWAPGCEVGDPIASPLNPVLYGRREGAGETAERG
jgi:ectoine hydroxylase-related dioxygenase (phytanoyl-CoA dioxygenase family)